jgi:hypothetical protein
MPRIASDDARANRSSRWFAAASLTDVGRIAALPVALS